MVAVFDTSSGWPSCALEPPENWSVSARAVAPTNIHDLPAWVIVHNPIRWFAHPRRSPTKQHIDARTPVFLFPSTIRIRADTQTSGTGLDAGEAAAIKGGAVANGVKAYILIQTVTNAAHVAREIRDLDGVLTADDVSGP